MSIPAELRERAREAYWNAVGGYEKVPPIEDTPYTTNAINASNQLIWNAAVEACAKRLEEWRSPARRAYSCAVWSHEEGIAQGLANDLRRAMSQEG